ncbi:unnamed protein product [Cuscuta campestris]|uniref:JmjC domain-containing protein n=1 Tax=Cuscuta campestris TaxID=132261 RepID=A0A484M0H6_9ASTE|nr:unnamed protein product [Cuscuta campestris]
MEHPRSTSGVGEDNLGIPDDLRCKRSDGKQWRCTAMSMPDKTVCEKHYIQAKKRAATSAMRASMKKAKKKHAVENDTFLESKSDDMDLPLNNQNTGDFSGSVSGKKHKKKVSKNQSGYFPETNSNQANSSTVKTNDDLERDASPCEESLRSYRAPLPHCQESSKNRSEKTFDSGHMTENSEGSSDASDNTGGQPCHQCRQNNHRVIWCLKCDRRGYCERCISTWYSDIPAEDIQKICPVCRGNCNCKVCLRGDILIKARVRDIPAQKKLQYLFSLLYAVLPVVKHIHHEQCSEVELEKRLRGNGIDLARMKLNSDEQMCCNFCRIPIIDYHRHCSNCSYDLCLSCCKDIREAAKCSSKEDIINQISSQTKGGEMTSEAFKLSNVQLESFKRIADWKANSNGSIPCPPKKYGGCGSLTLVLRRIFKMNWVAKLVKNVEEMVGGCVLRESGNVDRSGSELNLCKAAHRENADDNYLYCPYSEDVKNEGIENFRKEWSKGKPIIVKEVLSISSTSIWDPMFIWRGVRETTDDITKDEDISVKAIDCLNWTEIDLRLSEFIRGYSEGRICENGLPQMLKLKDWPSPSASEELLLYQRPGFLSKVPLLEFIHSKWGLLNVAAKLPHYSLQNDVGPKILISYGLYEELSKGDAVHNLHINMRDMVFLLIHTREVKLKGWQRAKSEKIQKTYADYDAKEAYCDTKKNLYGDLHTLSHVELDMKEENGANMNTPQMLVDQGARISSSNSDNIGGEDLNCTYANNFEGTQSGATWDVFRRQDIPKLVEYLRCHKNESGEPENVPSPLYDGTIYLNTHHKEKLKANFGIEPWSFEQHLGDAIFIPAGCPFQARNLQSTVQLGLDFLSPESLGEAVRMTKEIRGLHNAHETKLQMLEVEKISLYAASSAIKEVQKLVLDPKIGPELGYEDPSLTASVLKNLEMMRKKQVACA